MTNRAVHWHEGMFLRPHHFNAAQQHWEQVLAQNAKWDRHYNWGLRAVELDLDALANYRLVVRVLRARLRDGTLVSIPEEGTLPAIDLKPAFERGNAVTAMLAVPLLAPGRANVAPPGATAEGIRYLVDTQNLVDLSTGVNPQPVRVRLPNLKLLLSGQDDAGYETLPVARVARSPRAEATPELDLSFIPPVLSCDAWPPLLGGILQNVYDRIGKKIELLANQIVSRGITFDSQAQGDPLLFEQLRELNQVYPVLGTLAFAQGVHPLAAYVELSRLVGQLAIFGATRRPPELPRYDHDDLAGCFYRVKQQVDALLNIMIEPAYKERAFVGAGLRMQVSPEPSWLESVWQMYIGVQSPLDVDDCIRLLTRPGELDMKVGSSDRVDTVFRMGLAGLRFTYAPHPPRALPNLPGLIYFQVNRESNEPEWAHVQKSLTLAIRLNENLIVGNIQGQRVLTIKTGGQTTTLQFTLYVVAQDSAAPWVESG
jgi:type VI secretion system protein ImpJ